MTWRKKQADALRGTAVAGPGTQGRIRRDNVGIAFGKAWKRGN
jgi:hypothetical protein